MNQLELLREKFKSEAIKGKIGKKKAIELAYADMSRRAQGHTSDMKSDCVEWLLSEVFNEPLKLDSEDAFNKWHEDICEELKKRHGGFGRIGRSQKVINMAFKYLSYVEDEDMDFLKYCHMTLDSYTLNWYKRICSNPPKNIEWSKIDNYKEYRAIQDSIRKHLENSPEYIIRIGDKETSPITLPATPFEAEFIIWEGEKINERYNNLIKELNNYQSKYKDADKWLIDGLFNDFLKDYSM